MNEWTKEQRRIAAADLAYRGAVAPIIRMGLVFRVAADIADAACDAESDYALMLERLDVSPADIDAAVAAIACGKHPPDSLHASMIEARNRLENARTYARLAMPREADVEIAKALLIVCKVTP